MKVLLFISFFFSVFFTALAQNPSEEIWHDGNLDLFSGEQIKGKVKYNLKQNSIQILYGEQTLRSYNASQVEYFEFYDATRQQVRQFYALPLQNASKYERLYFFELLTEGEVTLLTREGLSTRYANNYNQFGFMDYQGVRYVLKHDFYLMDEKGFVHNFHNKRQELYHLMPNYVQKIEQYIKVNKLRMSRKIDLIRIVDYYNRLKAQENLTVEE